MARREMRRLRVQIRQLAAVVFEMVVVLWHYFLVGGRGVRIESSPRKNRDQDLTLFLYASWARSFRPSWMVKAAGLAGPRVPAA